MHSPIFFIHVFYGKQSNECSLDSSPSPGLIRVNIMFLNRKYNVLKNFSRIFPKNDSKLCKCDRRHEIIWSLKKLLTIPQKAIYISKVLSKWEKNFETLLKKTRLIVWTLTKQISPILTSLLLPIAINWWKFFPKHF